MVTTCLVLAITIARYNNNSVTSVLSRTQISVPRGSMYTACWNSRVSGRVRRTWRRIAYRVGVLTDISFIIRFFVNGHGRLRLLLCTVK